MGKNESDFCDFNMNDDLIITNTDKVWWKGRQTTVDYMLDEFFLNKAYLTCPIGL